jgi:Icc-related predicted phosphoesterase
MTGCFFVSDLHGKIERYRKLFAAIATEAPQAVFIGGDILPNFGYVDAQGDFLVDFLFAELARLRIDLGEAYPRVFIILGNDDGRAVEESLIEASGDGLLSYMHGRKGLFERWTVYGYSHAPPSPFLLKDWERYDVSRYVDPGCVSPEEGMRTVPISSDEARFGTIAEDLAVLAGLDDLTNAVFLFHAPPHKSNLDRAGLDGRSVDRAPLDVHVGSIAIRRFIEASQPLLTLHGHVHESARITGSWRDRFGRTVALSAAHDGPELALVRFDLEDPAGATRELL